MQYIIWAHETAAILGFNPYETKKHIFEKKRINILSPSLTPSLSLPLPILPPIQSISGNQIKEDIRTVDELKLYILKKYCEKTGYYPIINSKNYKKHKYHDFLCATIDGQCENNNNQVRLIKMNYKKSYKYNDISPKKLATHQLSELLVIMEVFDVDSIDYVRYRYDTVDILTIERNSHWFNSISVIGKFNDFYNTLVNNISPPSSSPPTNSP